MGQTIVAGTEGMRKLIPALARRGYEVIGPVVRDGAIVYGHVEKIEDLPAGWTARLGPGSYRLAKRDDGALFGYAAGPKSLKSFLHPPETTLFTAERDNGTFRVIQPPLETPRYAFLGVRACELAAMERQDRVLLGDRYADAIYESRRKGVFLVAVNCTAPAATCFCASMGAGPEAVSGFDLVITEITAPDRHELLVASGTPAGAEVLAELEGREAPAATVKEAGEMLQAAGQAMRRAVETQGLKETLYANFEHPEWERVAARCLACGNCTSVCPTCFCVTVEDSTDVSVRHAERRRTWDSCFTLNFTYIHGGSVRPSVKARYRQWLTHKFAAWQDQFGASGCVGCGRCIAWCPAGIDVTEELTAICRAPGAPAMS